MAQVDYFLKLDGVAGEATDDKHKGELDLESFSWGVTQLGTAGKGGGAGAGKAQPQDMVVTKRTDKSSPTLFIACATGQHFKEALLTVRKAGGQQQEYLKIKLEGVMVTSYQAMGTPGGNGVVQESIAFNYAKMEMIYKEQKADGSLGGETKQKYDYEANKKV
jgi:type VI secretion system secreted protein Hcp